MKYQVTVVIPTLNEEKFIRRCLDSVLSQTFPLDSMEILVLDGGSSDKTRNIVEGYISRYNNIRLINNSKRIQSAAFNRGVEASNAPFIIRLDAHAIYDTAYIKECIDTLTNDNKLLFDSDNIGNVGGVWDIKPPHKGLVAESSAILNKTKFGIGGASFRIGAPAGYVDTVPFGAFPRCVLERVGGMREDLPRGEDNEFNSRLIKNGYKIFLNPNIRCTYFARDTFKGIIKQMYANGYSIGRLFFIDRDSIGFRHCIPLLFVLSLFIVSILSIITPYGFYLLIGILGLYFIADIGATIQVCMRYGMKHILTMPFLFFVVHIAYGWGTIIGLLKGGKSGY